jgi:hypothetical protein
MKQSPKRVKLIKEILMYINLLEPIEKFGILRMFNDGTKMEDMSAEDMTLNTIIAIEGLTKKQLQTLRTLVREATFGEEDEEEKEENNG